MFNKAVNIGYNKSYNNCFPNIVSFKYFKNTTSPHSKNCLYVLINCNATVPTSQSILQLHREKEGQVKCINTTRFRDGKLNWLSMKMKSSIQSLEVSA